MWRNGGLDLRRASVKRRSALFRPVLRFRKVCIIKLSHFRGSLQAPSEILQSEPLTVNTSAFIGTNPTDELITSRLLVNQALLSH